MLLSVMAAIDWFSDHGLGFYKHCENEMRESTSVAGSEVACMARNDRDGFYQYPFNYAETPMLLYFFRCL